MKERIVEGDEDGSSPSGVSVGVSKGCREGQWGCELGFQGLRTRIANAEAHLAWHGCMACS